MVQVTIKVGGAAILYWDNIDWWLVAVLLIEQLQTQARRFFFCKYINLVRFEIFKQQKSKIDLYQHIVETLHEVICVITIRVSVENH